MAQSPPSKQSSCSDNCEPTVMRCMRIGSRNSWGISTCGSPAPLRAAALSASSARLACGSGREPRGRRQPVGVHLSKVPREGRGCCSGGLCAGRICGGGRWVPEGAHTSASRVVTAAAAAPPPTNTSTHHRHHHTHLDRCHQLVQQPRLLQVRRLRRAPPRKAPIRGFQCI